MARTKQTERRSTGEKAPRRALMKAAIRAASIAAYEAYKKRVYGFGGPGSATRCELSVWGRSATNVFRPY